MTSDIHYLELTELSRRIHAREISSVEAIQPSLRIGGWTALRSYAHLMAEAALTQARAAKAEIKGGEIRGPFAWRANRGEGPVLDGRRADRRRHDDPPGLPPHRGRHRGAQAVCRRRDHPGQAAAHRGRLRRPPPADTAAGKPVEPGALVGRVIERVGRRRPRQASATARSGPTPAVRSVSVRRQRDDRAQADLGPGQPLWRVRTRGDARSHRADGPQRRRLRRDAAVSSRGADPTTRRPCSSPCPITWPG